MGYTNFEYSVSSRRHSTSPFTAELTCTEVCRKQIRFFTDEINLLSLPEQTIVHHSTSIPLNEPNSSSNTPNDVVVYIARSPKETTFISRPNKTTNNHSLNYARILDIMRSFGVTEHGCSTILREIEIAIISSSSPSKGTGVIEVKIWKIRAEVYKLNRAVERLLLEKCCSDIPAISSLRVFGYNSNGSTTTEDKECVICMEDYKEGSLGIKLPCNHEFHGPCIFKWLQIKNQCPLCRLPISRGVKYYIVLIQVIP